MKVYVLMCEQPGDYNDYYQRPTHCQSVWNSSEEATAWITGQQDLVQDGETGKLINECFVINWWVEEHELQGRI